MTLSNDEWMDASKHGSITKYTNHSCTPNGTIHRVSNANKNHTKAFLQTRKHIHPGDEITSNYGNDHCSFFVEGVCTCGCSMNRFAIQHKISIDRRDEKIHVNHIRILNRWMKNQCDKTWLMFELSILFQCQLYHHFLANFFIERSISFNNVKHIRIIITSCSSNQKWSIEVID